MGKTTGIEWTAELDEKGNVVSEGSTHNFWYGCSKISPGCSKCFAERDMTRYKTDFNTVTRAKGFDKPLSWKKPRKIFTNSWSDFFILESDPWRPEAWEVIRKTPQHTYMILTKRPERIKDHLPSGWPLPNVWLGVSVENQKYADERIPLLLEVPAKVHFLSCEPLLGPLDLQKSIGGTRWIGGQRGCRSSGADHVGVGSEDCPKYPHHHHDDRCKDGIKFCIVGGESGKDARPMEVDWAIDLRYQCQKNDVAFFFKQGSQANWKKFKDFDSFPKELQAREYPKL